MNTRMCKPMLAVCLSFNFATAGATVIHDTGTTWVLNEILNDNVFIEDSKLVVTSGGVLRGADPAARIRSGELDVIGTGRVIATPSQPPSHLAPRATWLSGTSTVRLRDQGTIVGDIYSDLSMAWDDEFAASVRLFLKDQSMVDGNINYSGYVRLEDQAIVRGSIFNAVNGNIGINMQGGLVTGTVHLGAGNLMSLNMDGGTILGGVGGMWGDLDLRMTGGTIDGGLRTGAAVDGEISGGRINDGIQIASRYAGDLRITGGQFDTALDDWLVLLTNERHGSSSAGSLDIWGGQFGYAGAGQGFLIDDLMSLSIHGRDLVYSNGWLTGYLSDGSWFSNALTFGSNWQGTFTIHNVPEPETIGLFLVGLMGMTLARRNGTRRA